MEPVADVLLAFEKHAQLPAPQVNNLRHRSAFSSVVARRLHRAWVAPPTLTEWTGPALSDSHWWRRPSTTGAVCDGLAADRHTPPWES
jgi:hypothetical protein